MSKQTTLWGLVMLAGVLVSGCTTQPTTTSTTTPPSTSSSSGSAVDPSGTRLAGDVDATVEMSSFSLSVKEIIVAPGQTLNLTVKTVAAGHVFVIDEFQVNSGPMSVGKDKVFKINIPVDADGKTYTYYCSVSGHRDMGMSGVIKVKAPAANE